MLAKSGMKDTRCRGHIDAVLANSGEGNACNSSSLIIVMGANQAREQGTIVLASREVECPRLCQPAVGLSSFSCLVESLADEFLP